MYDNQQFEAGFQLITAVSHQIIKIDFGEMEIWIDKLLGPRALKNEEVMTDMNNLKTVMHQFMTMQEVLKVHGIPVRNIQHYKDSIPQLPGDNPNPNYR